MNLAEEAGAMQNDQESDATNGPSADGTESCAGVHYVAPAPLIDVLFEQLDYLATHLTSGEDCPSACPVCARLDHVSRYLLAPFHDPFNQA
jgi:hypothetical protein